MTPLDDSPGSETTTAVLAATLVSLLSLAGCESPSDGDSSPSPSESVAASSTEEGPTRLEWSDTVTVASGKATAGRWRMNDSRFHYVDDPTVSVTSNGTVAVTWVDNERQQIYFQKYDDSGAPLLESPVRVTDSPETFSWLPKMVVSGAEANDIYVLWQEIVFSGGTHGGEAFFARSTDGGSSFSEPINLSKTKAGDGKGRLTQKYWHNGSLDIARSGETLFATWTEYEGRLWLARSKDGGQSFTKPRQVAGTTERPVRGPDFAVGPDGRLHLAWTVGEDPSADIRLASATDGSFGEPRVPFRTDGHADAPKIAVDDAGTLHLAWGYSPSGPLRAYHVRYAKFEDGEATEPRRLASPGDGVASKNFPALRTSGEDHVYVLWERFPDIRKEPRGLGLAHSHDGGDSFTDGTTVPGSTDPKLGVNGSLQGQLMQKLDVGGAGTVAVVNSRFKENEASRIRLHLAEVSTPESSSGEDAE